MASALGDSKVLDFSRVLAGPLATMVLARPRGGGDEGRVARRRRHAPVGAAVRRGRRRDLLPVGQPQQGEPRARPDRRRAISSGRSRLAVEADVLVENFRPGVTANGSASTTSRCGSPTRGLIYCSITGFGAGEGATLPGYDLLVQALGGLMSITGDARRRAAEGRASRWSTCSPACSRRSGSSPRSSTAATAGRGAAGRGRSALGAARRARQPGARPTRSRGVVAEPDGQRASEHRAVRAAAHAPTASSSSRSAPTASSPRCARCSARPSWRAIPRFETNAARVENRDALREALEERLAARPAARVGARR